MRVNAGDFVLVDYKNFSGEIVKGIYLIIYHESVDISSASTFLAVKVSTNPSSFQIPIAKKVFKFLDHDSYINVGSIHRFKETEVLQILGTANKYALNNVRGQLGSLIKSADKQLEARL